MIYNINLGIGWASSGVEYAQIYRAKLFRLLNKKAKFVFLDFISSDNVQHMTRNIGFYDDEVIWLYQYFTDIEIAPSTYPLQKILDSINQPLQAHDLQGKQLTLQYTNTRLQIRLAQVADVIENSSVESVEWIINGRLIQKDYYSYTKVFTEYYQQDETQLFPYQRSWFNENGTIAYDEMIALEGDAPITTLYRFDKQVFYNKQEFVAHFFRSLNLNKDDTIIIDRDERVGQVILENKGASKVLLVVHADHFAENEEEKHYVLWNNYYEYMFMNANKIDTIITSTNAQTELLKRQIGEFTKVVPNDIVTIPVGALEQLKYPDEPRKPFSLVTASRLAGEKHIDWLIRAVVKAKQWLPELTFDIYGMGSEQQMLQQLIEELGASEYIFLKGHHHLTDIYKRYQIYVSASTSEGFGLTLLEAVGSGLGLIGFDVRYGNPTFIDHKKNGYLIKEVKSEDVNTLTNEYAQAIVQLFTKCDLDDVANASYSIATPYLVDNIAKRWDDVITQRKEGG